MKLFPQPLAEIYLHPGELIICHEPRLLTTVLGSCVSVTMFSRQLGQAAICHALLPSFSSGGASAAGPNPLRYVSHVVPLMCDHFRDAGAKPSEIEVKLFGGSIVIGTEPPHLNESWIGSANIREARAILHRNRFSIRAANVGGNRGRKLLFNTQTGEVLHKHLPSLSTI